MTRRELRKTSLNVAPSHAALFAELGLTSETIFTDPRIKVWRKLSDRENAMLDHVREDGSRVRLHIKRYPPGAAAMADAELKGFELLKACDVPAAPIIASGSTGDGSKFIVLEDLAGYTPADKLLAAGFEFERLLGATADMAALLHKNQLHHRDLYLCHFMIRPLNESVDAKLIDMARVSRLDNFLTRKRWIVKDLAQFWYSTMSVAVSDEQRERWLKRYCDRRNISVDGIIGPVRRKSAVIARHDVQLRQRQPYRNVSIVD